MDKKISNKIVQIKDIIHMAEIISLHNRYYVELEQAEKRKKEQAKERDEFYMAKYIYSYVKFSIQFNNNETITKDNELDWFKETLSLNSKIITQASISFSASEGDVRETLRLEFTPKRIYFDTTSTNFSGNSLASMIEVEINKLPPRYDELVDKDTRRLLVPALTISIPLGIIVSLTLLILAKVGVISAVIAKFLTNGLALTSIFLIIAYFGALLLPTKNTELYKNIKFETYYEGFDYKRARSIRRDDYAEYKSKCEVAIGENAHMPAVRQAIESNYKKAKKVVLIELIVAVVVIALFFIL